MVLQSQMLSNDTGVVVAGATSHRQPSGGRQAVKSDEWATVMASLAELGFQIRDRGTPPAAEVVLAAQLRLRYWRRQLPCGRLGVTNSRKNGAGQVIAAASHAGREPSRMSSSAPSDRPSTLSAAFVRERIRSIKSARDCLLACSQQGGIAVAPEV